MHAIRSCFTFGISSQSARFSLSHFGVCLAALLFGASLRCTGQTVSPPGEVAVATVFPANEIAEVQSVLFAYATADELLPDAPEPQKTEPPQDEKPLVAAAPKTTPAQANAMPMAPMYSRVIPAGMATPQIHKWDKITLAARNLYSLSSFTDFVVSAGYSHVTNGQPNYGTNAGAFGQRLGATALRDTTDTLFAESVFAPMFHQDPRYYVMGDGHSFIKRVLYAGTRPLITRTDSGHETLNSSLLVGYAAS